MNNYEVTYFHSPSPDAASWDTPWTITIGAEDYDEASLKFKEMKLGYLWSVDEVDSEE